jgi:hypothetical protein
MDTTTGSRGSRTGPGLRRVSERQAGRATRNLRRETRPGTRGRPTPRVLPPGTGARKLHLVRGRFPLLLRGGRPLGHRFRKGETRRGRSSPRGQFPLRPRTAPAVSTPLVPLGLFQRLCLCAVSRSETNLGLPSLSFLADPQGHP